MIDEPCHVFMPVKYCSYTIIWMPVQPEGKKSWRSMYSAGKKWAKGRFDFEFYHHYEFIICNRLIEIQGTWWPAYSIQKFEIMFCNVKHFGLHVRATRMIGLQRWLHELPKWEQHSQNDLLWFLLLVMCFTLCPAWISVDSLFILNIL